MTEESASRIWDAPRAAQRRMTVEERFKQNDEMTRFRIAATTARADYLIRSKESLRREKDLAVIEQLRHLRAP